VERDVLLNAKGYEKLQEETGAAVDRQAPGGRDRHSVAREFGDISEKLGVRRRQERADCCSRADREARGAPALARSSIRPDRRRPARWRRARGQVRTSSASATRRTASSARPRPTRRGRLSNESPVGRALIGHIEGRDGRGERACGHAQAQDRQHSPSRREPEPPGSTTSPPLRRPAPRSPTCGARTASSPPAMPRGALSAGPAGDGTARARQGRVPRPGGRSGRLQLLASADELGEELFAAVCDTQLGDIVGVAGEVISSRRGELTLRLEEFQLLAPCERPLPDLPTASPMSKHATASATST